MNLSAVDLNLLYVLHVVLEERNATRAAKRLHVTQSAVSNALARLRDLLGDPLVVRQARGVVPTPRAEALAPVLAEMARSLEGALSPGQQFDPTRSQRTFTLAAADNHQAREVPRVIAAFSRAMPRAHLRIVSADYLAATDGLANGTVDAAFMPQLALQPGHRSRVLFEEQAALVVRKDHPRVKQRITPELFAELPQIEVQVALGRTGSGHHATEQHWRRTGLSKSVALSVPFFFTAALAAAHTDCVAGLPHRAAEVFCQMLPLRIVPATFPLPSLFTVLAWHERTDADAGASFFRQLIVEATVEEGIRSPPRPAAARRTRAARRGPARS